MSNLPSFTNLQKEYLDPRQHSKQQVCQKIGGKVKVNNFANTCAIRLSRTLNYNGLELPGPNQFHGLNVVSGEDKKWYAYRVREIDKWLRAKLGKPQFERTKKEGVLFDKKEIANYKGIIGFEISFSNATGHLDLWDGDYFTSERAGKANDYWNKATRIWIWKAAP